MHYAKRLTIHSYFLICLTMRILLPILLLIGGQLSAAQPNVIVIVADDAGFADFGFMDPVTGGTTKMLTPALDTLRSRGTLFTMAYTGPVCSPSRGAILTGSYQQRVGYEYNISNHMGVNDGPDGFANADTIAFERMKDVGYQTLAIGKWHVGALDDKLSGGVVTVPGNRPPRQGVDHFFGLLGGSRSYTVPLDPGQEAREEKLLREMSPGASPSAPANNANAEDSGSWNGDLTDAFGQRAREYVTDHANQADPFFLYLAFTAPHGPLEESSDYALLNNPGHPNYANFSSLDSNQKMYCSMLYTMDKNIGLLMDHLDDPDGNGNNSDSIVDDTLVIFINDNGAPTSVNTGSNLPLRGVKGSIYDGGCRVPMLMAGPGIPVNGTFAKPVHSMDILATAIGAGGNPLPTALMGKNLIPHINGTDPSDPHEYVCVRMDEKIGLRKGDWKLIIKASGATSLYNTSSDIGDNTSSDIGESTNVAGANPAVLQELLQDAAEFDVMMDKPHNPRSDESHDTVNYNYSFRFDPADTTNPGVDKILIDYDDGIGGNGIHDSAVRNGGFESNTATTADGRFNEVSEWYNLTGNQTVKAIKNNEPSPIGGGWNAVLTDAIPTVRDFAIDTDHSLVAGEQFTVSYDWLDASNWTADDRVRFILFTTSNNSITGARTAIHSSDSSSSTNTTYKSESFTFTVPSGVDGKTLFLQCYGVSGSGASTGFARVDNIYLARLSSGSSQAAPQLWSTANQWQDPAQNQADTLLEIDSCSRGILIFPAEPGYDYIAQNDLERPTGLEFIQNTLRTEGTGTGGKTATISGNSIILADNFLTGKQPTFNLLGNGPDYSFDFSLDIHLYHDAVIKGDGTARHRISGELKDFEHPASLTKQGSSRVILAHDASYTGSTVISDGVLELAPGVTLAGSARVFIWAGGTLGGSGTVSGDVSGAGTIAPGQSIGTLTFGGDAQAGSLQIELDSATADRLDVAGTLNTTAMALDLSVLGPPTSDAYIIASYGAINGPFASVSGLPAGYQVHYGYESAGYRTHIALVKEMSLNAYEAWVVDGELLGAAADFGDDSDGDRRPNGIEFLFATSPSSAAQPWHPEATKTAFTFPAAPEASSLLAPGLRLMTSTDLKGWNEVTGSPTSEPDHFAPGVDRLSFDVSSLPDSDQRFFHLSVSEP